MTAMKRVYLDIDSELHQGAKVKALHQGTTLKNYLCGLIVADLSGKLIRAKTKEVSKDGTRKKTTKAKVRKAKR